MGNRDVVASNFRMRGSASHIVDLLPNAALADGVWSAPPAASAESRGVRYRTEGNAGIPDTTGVVLKDGNGAYSAFTYVVAPSVLTNSDPTVGIQAAIDALADGGTVYLPPGTYTVGTIRLRNHVRLLGAGEGTVLKAKANIGGPVLQEAADGDRFITIESLRIDGNKAAQSSGSNRHGIWLNSPTASPQEYADAYHRLLNVTVVNCKDDGIRLEGRGESKISNVNVRDCDGVGVNLDAPDCDLNLVTVGGAGLQGFLITEANQRLSNCKAFYCGLITAASGHGFHGNGTHTVSLINCEAQDCQRHGFYAQSCDRMQMLGCVADSNNAGHSGAADQSGNGVQIDGSSYCTFIGASRDRGANTRPQKFALGMANGAAYLLARIRSDGNLSGHIQNGWHTNVDLAINGYGGSQDLAYAASRTPNPTEGNHVNLAALTGNITINVPAAANSWTGAEMTIEFLQDGDGGAVITWGAGFKTDFVLNTGANKRGSVAFRYNGTDWVQIGAGATNL